MTRAPPSHLVEIPKFKFWKKILLEKKKKLVISIKSGYPSNSINAISPQDLPFVPWDSEDPVSYAWLKLGRNLTK